LLCLGRQRRKKCDEARPICSSCSARQVCCRWRRTSAERGDDASSYHRRDRQAFRSPSSLGSLSPISDTNSLIPGAQSPSFLQGACDSSPLQNSNLNPSNIFTDCAEGLPSCSLVDLLQVFDQATSGHDFGHEYSLLAQGFSSLSMSRSMIHAWLSCSAMLISQFQPSWRTHALRQYTQALRELRETIRTDVDVMDESSFSTTLILHIFGVGLPRMILDYTH
jgi:hypothetical protein